MSATGYIVTGTDTGIGKTVFAAGLTAHIGATYWKPIQSGLEDETDTQTVQRLANLPDARVIPEAYQLTSPLSPHRAAELDSITIDPESLKCPQTDGAPLVIEGAGGLLVPITRNTLQIDLFAQFGLPLILCARTSLGTINHTLLSLEAIRARSLPLTGIAFIGTENADSEKTICAMGNARHLGRLPNLELLTPDTLLTAFATSFTHLTPSPGEAA